MLKVVAGNQSEDMNMLRRRAGRTIFVWALRFPRVVSIQFRENG